MKKLMFIASLFIFYTCGFAQGIAINETGLPADATALVDMSTHTKGLLIPRLRTIERTAIVAPAEGLFVYDTDTQTFWYATNFIWKEILKTGDNTFSLPYDGIGADPNKLFSITNNSAALSTSIYGRRFNGSGLGLSLSNGIWGDNADGNGVAGTSTSSNGVGGYSDTGVGVSAISNIGTGMNAVSTGGLGISSTSQSNFGVAGSSNGVDKAGIFGVNINSTGNGYGVIGLIENPTGGAAVFGKNNAAGGNAGLFTINNNSNFSPALKASTSGNGPAGYFTTSGGGHAAYMTSTNAANTYPILFVDNTSSGTGISVSQGPSTTSHGIYVNGLGSGTSLYSLADVGRAGFFGIFNAVNINSALETTTYGKGKAAYFLKNNTTGSISDQQDPAVLIDNTSKGNALKITSLHSPSVNCGIDVNYDGQAFGINASSTHGGIHASSQSATGSAMLAENYSGGFAIKGYSNASLQAAIYAENSHMFGIGMKAVVTGSQAIAIQGVSNSAVAAVEGITTGGVGIRGYANGAPGNVCYGVKGETNATCWGIPGYFVSNCPTALTNTLWAIDYSLGQTMRIQVNNTSNASEALFIEHDGTGKLASFNHNFTEKFSVANNGDVTTTGTVTVKGDKGIVRSAGISQMIAETIVSPTLTSANLAIGGSVSVTINFAGIYNTPPTVSVANLSTGFTGPCDALSTCIKNVTTTSCTLKVFNTYMSSTGAFSGTWKIMVLGAE